MIDIKLIPTHLLKTLRADCEMTDESIERSSPFQLLDKIMEWEGIIGFTNMIIDAYDDFNEAVIAEPVGESDDTKLIRKLVEVIEDFMPNIGQCALQDYGRLNEALMESDARLKGADDG